MAATYGQSFRPAAKATAANADRPLPGRPAVLGALGANAGMFGLWHLSGADNQGAHRLANVLYDHALCSRENLRLGRLHSLLLSSVSHSQGLHAAVNMYGIHVFGNVAAAKLSPLELGGVLCAGGIGSSLLHVACHPRMPVMGASGALMALVTMDAALEPERQFHTLLPGPGLTLSMYEVAGLAFAANAIGFAALRHRLPTVAWAAHLGGTFVGVGIAVGANLLGDDRFGNFRRIHEDWLLTARDRFDE
eukprot:TRINITY_DN65311_c0_g1_i1.p1 TRINITY_DN65311_c0_g1~~TRINITY_DN65311_c0_g1_i1.p1  ORF type:complete len:249 (-),score=47.33 TRINITY_DN65311_c0_g1_i1:25-771(-)